jgi:hypothetical protein
MINNESSEAVLNTHVSKQNKGQEKSSLCSNISGTKKTIDA